MLSLDAFLNRYMKRSDRFVPARLQAALSLLERVRDFPTLLLSEHLAGKGSAGLKSHETFGNRAHERLNLQALNKIHGRRSSNLQEWGQPLLEIVRAAGFERANSPGRDAILSDAQQVLAVVLRGIIEQDPLEAHMRGRTVKSCIHEVLLCAEEKGKAGEVAQYLVAAKLMLRFGEEIPVQPANKSDRSSRIDPNARAGDFTFEDAVIEVAVGLPDDKHIEQIASVLENSDCEIWLLTRADRVATWENELESTEGLDEKRVVVSSVEAFVGQNVTELGRFSSRGKATEFKKLIDLYNTRWVDNVGTPGIRIILR
jgi:hypothetical protein